MGRDAGEDQLVRQAKLHTELFNTFGEDRVFSPFLSVQTPKRRQLAALSESLSTLIENALSPNPSLQWRLSHASQELLAHSGSASVPSGGR